MAQTPKENKSAGASSGTQSGETKTENKKPVDYIEQIGRNFNVKNAKEIFGAKAYDALRAVSKAGGHGVENWSDDEFNSLGFSGLQIPFSDNATDDAKYAETRAKINDALNGLE